MKHIICPAVEGCGYKALRADHISEPGIITSQVIQHIVDDPLVVADLTGKNPNVFYELALRHALRKPLVQLIKKGENIPFDVAGTRTIHVDHTDLDSVDEARAEITAQVKHLEGNSSDIETPISISLDLQVLRQSENPEERYLADMLPILSEMRSAISGLEKRIEDPENLIPPQYLRHVLRKYIGKRSVPPHLAYEIREASERLSALDIGSSETIERHEIKEVVAQLRRYSSMLIHEFE